MELAAVMAELEALGNPQTKKTYQRHGAPEPLFGVRVGDLKSLLKRLRGRQELALQLYATGNSDAMYLAGLIADGARMTKQELKTWAKLAPWYMIAEYTVPWVAAEHPHGLQLAEQWLDARQELIAAAGWSTLAALAATVHDDQLPIERLQGLLDRVEQTLPTAANRVRYAMNGYVICVGTYVAPLAESALAAAGRIGVVQVEMGRTECRVPEATSYILKSRRGKPVAPKRKTVRCSP